MSPAYLHMYMLIQGHLLLLKIFMIQLFCFFAPTSPYVLCLCDRAKCSSWCDQSIMNLDQILVVVVTTEKYSSRKWWLFHGIAKSILCFLNFGTKKRSEINELQPRALIHIAREIRTFRPFDAQLGWLGFMDLIVVYQTLLRAMNCHERV